MLKPLLLKSLLLKPLFKWAGSKRLAIKHLCPLLPPNFHTLDYYEPFIGSGAALFGFLPLKPSRIIVADGNLHISNIWKVLRHPSATEVLIAMVKRLTADKESFNTIKYVERTESYLELEMNTTFVDALRSLYLFKTCFNGIYRETKNGYYAGTVGKFSSKNGSRMEALSERDIANLTAVSEYLYNNNVKIVHSDISQFFDNVCDVSTIGRSFTYLDPPYFTEYNLYKCEGFVKTNGYDILFGIIEKLDNLGGRIMLSVDNSETSKEFLNNLSHKIKSSKIRTIQVLRQMSSDINNRKLKEEYCFTNY